MNNFVKVCEVSNKAVDWMSQTFQSTKEINVTNNTNNTIQGWVGKVDEPKRSDTTGTKI